MPRRAARIGAGLLVAVAGAGCGESAAVLLETASLAVSPSSTVHPEQPVEVYSRVARGALACWFGPSGSLKRTHIFHADVQPESKGGEAEIVLHERDSTAVSPRALRAYRIVIVRAASGSRMVSENLRLADALARDLQADAHRWATGKEGCSVVGVGGWSAAVGPPREAEAASAEPPGKAHKGRRP